MEAFLEQHPVPTPESFKKDSKDHVSDLMHKLGERKFTFGKHKDSTYEEVFKAEPSYVAYILRLIKTESAKFYKNPIRYYKWRVENQ